MKMIVRELPQPQTLARAAAIRAVSLPTIGHYLEEGFVDPEIRMLVGDGSNVAGPAVTVRTTATDSTALHHAAGMIEDVFDRPQHAYTRTLLNSIPRVELS
uniref:hypothetical protein n=1 Tax=Leucobacter aridicollis TaxID=283878 RepID=UPI0037C940D4